MTGKGQGAAIEVVPTEVLPQALRAAPARAGPVLGGEVSCWLPGCVAQLRSTLANPHRASTQQAAAVSPAHMTA